MYVPTIVEITTVSERPSLESNSKPIVKTSINKKLLIKKPTCNIMLHIGPNCQQVI